MNEDAARGRPAWLGLILFGVLALLALSALGTIFVGVVTAVQAWQENAEEHWPVVTARVEKCYLRQSSTRKRDRYYISCRFIYQVGFAQNEANIYSARVQWPFTGPMQEWIDAHPAGSPIEVRYDPTNHKNIVLMPPYMPGKGPHTQDNVKLLMVCAGSFAVLLLVTRVMWPRIVPARTS
jgi:Protein of unknown function (DUF3592)